MSNRAENGSSVPRRCPVCGAAGSVSKRSISYKTAYNKVPVELADVECFACESCGEEFFDKRQSQLLSAKVKDAARERLGALSPERIILLRKKLDISQQELESLLGLGDKVVTRWETGRVVPGRATDYLLRLMERKPEILEDLRAIRQEISAPLE